MGWLEPFRDVEHSEFSELTPIYPASSKRRYRQLDLDSRAGVEGVAAYYLGHIEKVGAFASRLVTDIEQAREKNPDQIAIYVTKDDTGTDLAYVFSAMV